jgi:hypothetical protein
MRLSRRTRRDTSYSLGITILPDLHIGLWKRLSTSAWLLLKLCMMATNSRFGRASLCFTKSGKPEPSGLICPMTALWKHPT